VKLLFDQNLSYRLVAVLGDVYPGSLHVRQVGLEQGSDLEVWEYARDHGLVIVSKDSDFHQLSFLYGPPPKAVWLRLGNCTTAEIEQVLRQRQGEVDTFAEAAEEAFLVIER
jgi:predicted nuclease of predicted toxin-antitoxin system